MGSSPAKEVKRKEKKWTVQVSYLKNGARCGTTLKGLDAPTESEVLKALYKQGCGNTKYEIIEITNSFLSD